MRLTDGEVRAMVFNTAGVVGAGTMGHGVAFTFAKGGCRVVLIDQDDSALAGAEAKIKRSADMFAEEGLLAPEDKGRVLSSILYTTNLEELAETELVVECIAENIELKQQLFQSLDQICLPQAILASNTSSLKLSDITVNVRNHRDKIILTHWFNPAQLVPLVELFRAETTSDETFQKVRDFHEQCGKVTIEVQKELPGLVANRVQIAMAREVFSLYEQGVASAEDIDKAVSAGPGFRLSVSGLLEIADLGGLDIWYLVSEQLLQVIDSSTKPNKVLADKMKANMLGAKTGEGFYKYSNKSLDDYVYERDRKLLKQLLFLSGELKKT